MNKYQKEKIVSHVKLIKNCNSEIIKLCNNGADSELIKQALTDAQEKAIEAGNMLEKFYKDSAGAVHFLEEYCEVLFCIFNVTDTDISKAGQFADSLFELIEKCHKEIETYTVKKLSIYLPYNASMWDSLEGLWRRDKEDLDMDTMVVPIPYFDKDLTGKFTNIHYEIDKYPEEIEAINCADINIEEYRPDFIYIHNPYDGGNKITSVYPDYYAKKLKDITDCLVYVPYFVLGEINNPYDLNELKSMEHFCLVAGVVYSHKVYVQSENMRRAYITVLTNNFKNEVLTEEYWESKIEVLKSPKITKLQNMIKTFDISSVPENWRKYKEGGNEENNCKKVVFYNTSVSQVLKNPDAVLKKIKSVLKVFFENKEKVVLLWRPHPLLPQTFALISDYYKNEYEKIVDEYVNGKWGIFDDSSDLDMAILFSDAYFGDESSLTVLFKETGKPIMIQNVEVLY